MSAIARVMAPAAAMSRTTAAMAAVTQPAALMQTSAAAKLPAFDYVRTLPLPAETIQAASAFIERIAPTRIPELVRGLELISGPGTRMAGARALAELAQVGLPTLAPAQQLAAWTSATAKLRSVDAGRASYGTLSELWAAATSVVTAALEALAAGEHVHDELHDELRRDPPRAAEPPASISDTPAHDDPAGQLLRAPRAPGALRARAI